MVQYHKRNDKCNAIFEDRSKRTHNSAFYVEDVAHNAGNNISFSLGREVANVQISCFFKDFFAQTGNNTHFEELHKACGGVSEYIGEDNGYHNYTCDKIKRTYFAILAKSGEHIVVKILFDEVHSKAEGRFCRNFRNIYITKQHIKQRNEKREVNHAKNRGTNGTKNKNNSRFCNGLQVSKETNKGFQARF